MTSSSYQWKRKNTIEQKKKKQHKKLSLYMLWNKRLMGHITARFNHKQVITWQKSLLYQHFKKANVKGILSSTFSLCIKYFLVEVYGTSFIKPESLFNNDAMCYVWLKNWPEALGKIFKSRKDIFIILLLASIVKNSVLFLRWTNSNQFHYALCQIWLKLIKLF